MTRDRHHTRIFERSVFGFYNDIHRSTRYRSNQTSLIYSSNAFVAAAPNNVAIGCSRRQYGSSQRFAGQHFQLNGRKIQFNTRYRSQRIHNGHIKRSSQFRIRNRTYLDAGNTRLRGIGSNETRCIHRCQIRIQAFPNDIVVGRFDRSKYRIQLSRKPQRQALRQHRICSFNRNRCRDHRFQRNVINRHGLRSGSTCIRETPMRITVVEVHSIQMALSLQADVVNHRSTSVCRISQFI